MPSFPLSRCLKCRERVARKGVSYCSKHLKLEYKREKQSFPSDKFYSSTKWRKNAKAFLAENPLCIKCLEFDLVNASKVCDHIIARADGGPDYDWNNLQALCDRCHNRKRAVEKHNRRRQKLMGKG